MCREILYNIVYYMDVCGDIYIGNVMECPWMSATCSLMASFCARSERERPKSAEIERPKVKVPTSAVAVSKEGNS